MKSKIDWKASFRHFILYFVISSLIITASITIYHVGPTISMDADYIGKSTTPFLPPNYSEAMGNIRLDQHSHTRYSDGILTVEQSVKWHISMGYNTFVITDHNNIKSLDDINSLSEKYKDEILIIPGMEWSTSRIHLNFLGIEEWTLPIPSYPNNTEIELAIDEVHAQGGVVTANHLTWSFGHGESDPTRSELLALGVDYIEIINDDNDPGDEFDYISYQFCLDNNDSIGMITGTDMHAPGYLGTGAIHGWTLIQADNFSREAVMEQLRDKNTSIHYYSKGVIHSQYLVLQPFYYFGKTISESFVSLGSFNAIGFVIFSSYFFITFLIIEGVVLLEKSIISRYKKRKEDLIEDK